MESFSLPPEILWPLRQVTRVAIQHLPEEAWRHHGIGVLQGYLREGDRELRVHIWDPSLVLVPPGQGDIHDHRFLLQSSILTGELFNVEYEPRDMGSLLFEEFEVLPYREATAAGGEYAPRVSGDGARVVAYVAHGAYLGAGQFYRVEPRVFHSSSCDALTVTLVEKPMTLEGVRARILCRPGLPLVNAFDKNRPRLPENFRALIDAAVVALGGNP